MAASPLLPETNRVVAEHLFALEVGLRELVIETLTEVGGAKWFKTLLPSDISQKYLRGLQAERAAKWSTHVEHHPLYYIDFPDIAKILEKNWKAIFKDVFEDKSVFAGNLKSLEPVRNKLAHNRKVSEQDCVLVEGVVSTFRSAIGAARLASLVQRCTVAPSISKAVGDLEKDVEAASECMHSLTEPAAVPAWDSVKNAWWFDSSFLTATNVESRLEVAESKLAELKKAVHQTEKEIENLRNYPRPAPDEIAVTVPVAQFFSLYEEFERLPRGRGVGHKLESWKQKNNIETIRNEAIASLHALLTGASNE